MAEKARVEGRAIRAIWGIRRDKNIVLRVFCVWCNVVVKKRHLVFDSLKRIQQANKIRYGYA